MLSKLIILAPAVTALNNGRHGKSLEHENTAPEVGRCEGTQEQIAACGTECGNENYVDCEWNDWSEWGPCTCEGLKERHRTIKMHNNQHGKACSGPKVETASCRPDCALDAEDCLLSPWTAWSTCDRACDGGQQQRERRVIQESKNGGKTCNFGSFPGGIHDTQPLDHLNAVLRETRGCNEAACADRINCVWGDWSEFSACSETCGGGLRLRDRSVKIAPRNGGKLCEAHTKTEVEACNTQACDKGCINGAWGMWSDWSTCTAECDGGYMMRHRVVAQTPNHCGLGLVGVADEYAVCNSEACDSNHIDCKFGEWSDYGDCSCPCNGVKDRSRRIATYATNGGKPCGGTVREVSPCNIGECGHKPVDCVLSQWGKWDNCSASCGGGIQKRRRTILTSPRDGGVQCDSILEEVKGCADERCEGSVDCAWGEWHDWGDCSHHCDGGEKTRYRHVKTMPKLHGAPCDPHASAEISACNTHKCHTSMYCIWGEWSVFGNCSTTCGSGQMKRSRSLMLSSTPRAGSWNTGFVILDSVLGFGAGMFSSLAIFGTGALASLLVLAVGSRLSGGRFEIDLPEVDLSRFRYSRAASADSNNLNIELTANE